MSDFTSNFWSVYVAALTLIGIFACLILLWVTARKKVASSADNTTGHVWDEDLREMNNPMPRWWMWLFVLTIVFSLGYLAAYPGLGSYAGQLGWSTQGEYTLEVAKATRELEPLYARFTAMKPEDAAGQPEAMAIGERLFMNNCAQCHGSDARGSKGFPNLADGDWLHGWGEAAIVAMINQGKVNQMPAQADKLTEAQIHLLTAYVWGLSNKADAVK